MKNLGTILGVALIVVLVFALFGGLGMMLRFGGMGGRGGMMAGYDFHPLGFIGPLFWLFVVGAGVWAAARYVRGMNHHPTASAGEIPLDILKVRYAKGEITKEQFEEMKKDLS